SGGGRGRAGAADRAVQGVRLAHLGRPRRHPVATAGDGGARACRAAALDAPAVARIGWRPRPLVRGPATEGTARPKGLWAAVLLVPAACGPARAGQQDVVGRLEKAGAGVSPMACDGEEDGLNVLVYGAGSPDAVLAELCELRRLRRLELSRTGVTDAGLRAVG